jgi:uncharacterized membrane protein YphA (DoxX/SURF4 family)
MHVPDRLLRRTGQLLLGAMFVKLGYDAAREPGHRVDRAAELGLGDPELAVRFNGWAMVAGGAALMLDRLPRLAAAGLVASLVPTTVAGHAFWNAEGQNRNAQTVQFLKNTGLAGGLLCVMANRKQKSTGAGFDRLAGDDDDR